MENTYRKEMSKYVLRGYDRTTHLTGQTEHRSERKNLALSSDTAKLPCYISRLTACLEALLQNATCTADVQEWDSTSKQSALEMEEEGADRAVYTTERERRRRSKKEQLGPCKETEQAAVGRASVWRCGKEGRRREGLIQASWEDIAQLAPVLVWREGESKEKGERLCPPGWWSGKALEGGG